MGTKGTKTPKKFSTQLSEGSWGYGGGTRIYKSDLPTIKYKTPTGKGNKMKVQTEIQVNFPTQKFSNVIKSKQPSKKVKTKKLDKIVSDYNKVKMQQWIRSGKDDTGKKIDFNSPVVKKFLKQYLK